MATRPAATHAAYRMRTLGDRVELYEDPAGTLCAATLLKGRAVFADLKVQCPADGAEWRCSPDRKVMPTRWRLTKAGTTRESVFSHRVAAKLLNPFGRRLLTLERPGTKETFDVVDVRVNGVGRLLGLTAEDWALVSGGTAVATLGYARATLGYARAPESQEGAAKQAGGGLLKRVRAAARSFGSYDRALVSLGERHALEPAEALVLILLFGSLTETS